MKSILLTGATGFVGSHISQYLNSINNYLLRAALRKPNTQIPDGVEAVIVGALDSKTQWQQALKDIRVIIHTAARVHFMKDTATDPLTEFRSVNLKGTLNLARQAAASGVKRFIFISSVKVNGEGTQPNHPYTEDDLPSPVDPYGISKYEAEKGLNHLAAETGMEVVIIRPPLIYGPGVKANFLSMMRWVKKGVLLPFGAIHNKRSFVALDNLVDLIVTCIEHPAAANQVFLAGDGKDLSTTELLRRVGFALGKPARLLPVHQKILENSLKICGKNDLAQRLCGSLQVDISKARTVLNWMPPVSVDEGLHKTARYFLESQSN